MLDGMETDVSEEHMQKAMSPNSFTPSGITKESNATHSKNAVYGISDMAPDSFTDVSELHLSKALLPNRSTDEGNTTSFSEEQR